MLLSVALILVVGMAMGFICKKVKLPSLLGLLITGIILGPYVLNLIDKNLLFIKKFFQSVPDLQHFMLLFRPL